jgi:hypothetical protein
MLKTLAAGSFASALQATTASAANIGVAMSNFDDAWLTDLRTAMTDYDATP